MNTWSDLQTRRGRLQEMAATLSRAKSFVDEVMQDYPRKELDGVAGLEHAIELIGICERELDDAADSEPVT